MTPSEIRVVHLITELDAGGAQTALLRLLEQHGTGYIQPHVVTLYNEDKIVAQQIRQLGIPVTGLGLKQSWRIDALWRLYQLLHTTPVDILHCWMFHADILGRLVGRLAGVPVVITSRRSIEVGGPRREQIKRWTASLDHQVVAVCEMARDAEIARTGIAPEKVRTIYNGINIAPYQLDPAQGKQMRQTLGLPVDALVVGTIGRLHPVKGYRYLLDAWPTICQQIPQARLLMVGDGELRNELQQRATVLAVGDQVVFTGTRRDIPELLATMDLFVLPSLWEGMPNVAIEAMAAGVPVIATAVGGTTEVIVDECHGKLIPPQDSEALAAAVIQLLQDPHRRDLMGEAGRQRVKDSFSIERTVTATLNLYKELLQQVAIDR